MIHAGDIITFRPEWRDAGDDLIQFVAIDDEEKGRVSVRAELGLPINPVSTVEARMIETVNGTVQS